MAKLPNIITKTGDKGETSLWSGERVEKNHFAIKCVAELDYLDSAIGVSYQYLDIYKDVSLFFQKIQSRLITLKGEIATHPLAWKKFYENFDYIKEIDTEELEKECAEIKLKLEKSGYKITGWIRYGEEGEVSAYIDYLRAICRKCEIAIYDLNEKLVNAQISSNIKIYINRLSDYFYWVARYLKSN
jgi:cob(I)alamin adenosyltransferase